MKQYDLEDLGSEYEQNLQMVERDNGEWCKVADVGWQPIEGAPKEENQKMVLLDHGEPVVGQWFDGWVDSREYQALNPTHYMLLPPDPVP